MKTLFCFLLVACRVSAQNTYLIKGATDLEEGIAILNPHSRTLADTVQIVNGQFEFRGEQEKPTFMAYRVPPANAGRMVLEPGTITISYKKKEGYRIGGTPNNERLQKADDIIKPYYEKLAAYWKKYRTSEGEERAKYYNLAEAARAEKAAKERALILADPHYSGFLRMLPVYRNESAGVVEKLLKHFKTFENDPSYRRVAEFYKGLAATDRGVQAPQWKRPDDKGNMVALSSFRGKYVLLDFWYSGCVWCRKMTPHLKKIYDEMKRNGMEIVSISVDPEKDELKWRQAMEEDGAPWPQVWDYEKKLPGQYGVMAYPTMFLLDPEGKVVEKLIGYREEAAFRELFGKYVPIKVYTAAGNSGQHAKNE